MITLQKAFDILEKLVHSEPEQARYHSALGRAWNALGFIHDEMRDNRKAIPAFEKAVKEQENAIDRITGSTTSTRRFFAFTWKTSASNTSTWVPSRMPCVLTIGHSRSAGNSMTTTRKYRAYARDLADALSKIGTIQRHAGDPTAALKSFLEARTVVEKFLTTAPDDPEMQGRLGAAFIRDAWIQSDLNQTDDALQSLQLAIDVLRPLSKLPPGEAEGRDG